MLKSISIDALYGRYNYIIDLVPERNRYKFITGPNGYGKSTVLRLLDSLYNCNLHRVAAIPFKKLELTYDDGKMVLVEQARTLRQEDGSDEQNKFDGSLKVSYKLNKSSEIKTYMTAEYSSDDIKVEEKEENLGLYLFFHSHPIYFIQDGRINTPEGVPAVRRCVGRMSELLKDSEHGGIKDFDLRLSVFNEIIGSAEFAHKSMEVEPRFGFRFRFDDGVRTILDVGKLSSGEQHIIIQAFELLFEAPDDSLVLIDEPEISFHLAWQMKYLENLDKIAKVRDLQFIVATHSPQIFGSRWDLTADLFEQDRAD